MAEAVEYLAHYMDTYNQQTGYEGYETITYLNDVLYGLGVSINKDKYSFAPGFAQFKRDLVEFINATTTDV